MGSQPSTTTSTVTQAVPPYLQAAQQQGIQAAGNMMATPFPGYTGTTVAPLSPMQNEYLQGVQSNQGAWQPTTAAAQGVYGNVASGAYQPNINEQLPSLSPVTANSIASGAGQYYDPAINTEVGGVTSAINLQNQEQNAASNRSAGIQGAYGGSGSNIQTAMNNYNADVATGAATAPLYQSALQTALGASQQDTANQMQAEEASNTASLGLGSQALGYQQLGEQASLGGGQLSLAGAQALENSGYTASNQGYTDAGQLGLAGQAEQNQATNQLQFPYSQYQQAVQYPFQTEGAYAQALGTVGANAGGTSTQQQPYSSMAQGIGTGLMALGGVGAAGNLASSAGDWFGSARGGRQKVHNYASGGPVRHFWWGGLNNDDDSDYPYGEGEGLLDNPPDEVLNPPPGISLLSPGPQSSPASSGVPPVAAATNGNHKYVGGIPDDFTFNQTVPAGNIDTTTPNNPDSNTQAGVQSGTIPGIDKNSQALMTLGAGLMSYGKPQYAGIGKGLLAGQQANLQNENTAAHTQYLQSAALKNTAGVAGTSEEKQILAQLINDRNAKGFPLSGTGAGTGQALNRQPVVPGTNLPPQTNGLGSARGGRQKRGALAAI